jgi:hypothetical protein
MMPPPWTRTDVVDPVSLQPLPAGQVGLLRHFDLTNLPTVVAVQTDNLGVTHADGSFQIIGRAQVDDAGKISQLPAERTVGPMGDNKIFRFLENYVNFSIRFKMGWITGRKPAAAAIDTTMGADCPCGEGIEQLIELNDNSEKSGQIK